MSIFCLLKLKNKGFTLIEALLAVVFLSIIGTGVIYFFKNSFYTLSKTQANINLRDESVAAFENLVNDLRRAESSTIVIDRFSQNCPQNSMVLFSLYTSTEKISYYQKGSALYINRRNITQKLCDNLVSVKFSSASYKTYSIAAYLSDSKNNFNFSTDVFVRN
ncbi:MAG: hypothetical protein AB1349_01190 [Elusimicrobiota bacterium]